VPDSRRIQASTQRALASGAGRWISSAYSADNLRRWPVAQPPHGPASGCRSRPFYLAPSALDADEQAVVEIEILPAVAVDPLLAGARSRLGRVDRVGLAPGAARLLAPHADRQLAGRALPFVFDEGLVFLALLLELRVNFRYPSVDAGHEFACLAFVFVGVFPDVRKQRVAGEAVVAPDQRVGAVTVVTDGLRQSHKLR
jgi:hypothetical protein